MQCNIQEFAAPSPTNTTNFSLQLPASIVSISVRSNSVFFDCYWQGNNTSTVTRNFVYILVSSTVQSWDDVTNRQNFLEWIAIASGTYALVEKY
jgi:hypothetical protein